MKSVYIFYMFLMVASIGLLLSEAILRRCGFYPYGYIAKEHSLKSDHDSLFVLDTLLGYSNNQGMFNVTLNNSLTYKHTIGQGGERINPFQPNVCRKVINIYGCSFFYGMGVNDSSVVSAQLSRMDTNVCVKNYSIPGHGLTTQFLLFKRHLKSGVKPNQVVFSIASFHLQRNVASFSYLRSFGNISNSPVEYPAARLTSSDGLVFLKVNTVSGYEQLARLSSIYTLFLQGKDRFRFPLSYQIDVHNKLCDSISYYSKEYGVKILFHFITKDEISDQLVQFMKWRNYPFVQSGVNYKDREYNLMPIDGHPNNSAHAIYAREIDSFLKSKPD
jgi:hypothetical protein